MTPDALEELIPPKMELVQLKVFIGSGEFVNVYFAVQQPIIFEMHDILYPTGTVENRQMKGLKNVL